METGPPPPTDPTVATRHIAALDYDLAKADVLERLKFQASFAEIAWKSLTLVNGGAIVALLTFVGNAKPDVRADGLWDAFAAFCLGLIFCTGSILTGFLAQAYFMKSTTSNAWNFQAQMHGHEPRYTAEASKELRVGNTFENIAVAAAILSLLAFVVGATFSVSAISIKPTKTVLSPAPVVKPVANAS